ncbi:ecdysone-induced protein 75B, isoforms C/D-like [Teleopsis dalmanni]|uniref:ecdysone-induced protein 75B, isoforms C/D-like n=1 Tax=Teleopsis dalmanni TaxID=139649 RepID=UPI0018CDC5D5|nr:ecdysone-induced protein 75B, isoforms C/D-like [Teleopsis dalmanni]
MLMSADSSDCRPSSSDCEGASTSQHASAINAMNQANHNQNQNPNQISNQNLMKTETSGKTSVICMSFGSANEQMHKEQNQLNGNSIVQALPTPSSTTQTTQVVVGRSHLENALKLPPHTSVSAYYQNTKLMPSSQNNLMSNDHESSSHRQQQIVEQQSHANSQDCVIFQAPQDYRTIAQHNNNNNRVIGSVSYAHASTSAAAAMSVPVTEMDTVPTGASSSTATSSVMPMCARKMPHSNVIYANNNENMNSNPMQHLPQPQQQQSSVHHSKILQNANSINAPTSTYVGSSIASHHHNHSVVSTSDIPSNAVNTMYDNYAHNSSAYHPHANMGNGTNSIYHPQQQHVATVASGNHLNGSGTVVVVAADSRPQTPDYIKSYPVMDTTVASSERFNYSISKRIKQEDTTP